MWQTKPINSIYREKRRKGYRARKDHERMVVSDTSFRMRSSVCWDGPAEPDPDAKCKHYQCERSPLIGYLICDDRGNRDEEAE